MQQQLALSWTHGCGQAQVGIARERLWSRLRWQICVIFSLFKISDPTHTGQLHCSLPGRLHHAGLHQPLHSGLAGVLHHGLTSHTTRTRTHPRTTPQNTRPQTPLTHLSHCRGQTTNAPAQFLPALAHRRGSQTGRTAACLLSKNTRCFHSLQNNCLNLL